MRPYLDQCFDLAESGTEYVITRYRNTNANLRTQLVKIIKRAGLKPWPRLFHNLRATRQTELTRDFPIHVVCEWLGNSKLIAQEHYLRVTDDDYVKALQNPVQQALESGRNEPYSANDRYSKPRFCPGVRRIAAPCGVQRWTGAESNRRHQDFQSCALPTELPVREWILYSGSFLL